MEAREQRLLEALAWMVAQYLGTADDKVLDSLSEHAGELALEALASYALVEQINARFGRWTEKGEELLRNG